MWLSLLTCLLAACGSLETPAVLLEPQALTPNLSMYADRSAAEVLGTRTLSGSVYIFDLPTKAVQEVLFDLDGRRVRQDSAAPYDLVGGDAQQARAFDTRALANGRHTLRVTLRYRDGRRVRSARTFNVANAAATPTATPAITPTPPALPPPRWRPAPGLSWQWQLQGTLDTSLPVDVYDVDLFDTSVLTIRALQGRGVRVVCYFSAGSFEGWREDAAAFPEAVKGAKMAGWDELWLDIRNLTALAPPMRARLKLAASKGCDAVEPDNVDAYSNVSGFPLSANDQLVYNRFLASEAHALGLAVGLKNDLEQVRALEPYFDFAVNEECFSYDECGLLTPFIGAGKAVFGAEYEAQTTVFCPVTEALGLSVIRKSYDLGVYQEACR